MRPSHRLALPALLAPQLAALLLLAPAGGEAATPTQSSAAPAPSRTAKQRVLTRTEQRYYGRLKRLQLGINRAAGAFFHHRPQPGGRTFRQVLDRASAAQKRLRAGGTPPRLVNLDDLLDREIWAFQQMLTAHANGDRDNYGPLKFNALNLSIEFNNTPV